MRLTLRIVAIILMGSTLAVCASDSGNEHPGKGHNKGKNGKVRQGRSENGSYVIRITGAYRGTGQASVSEDTVSLTATVTTGNGADLQFVASQLTIDGPYFDGAGTVDGQTLTIRGRLDAAKASRLVATYRTPNHHDGRIVGTLPTDDGDNTWDAH